MRLLHQRHDHAGSGVHLFEQKSDRGANQASIGLQPVPVWNAPTHCARRETRLLRRLVTSAMTLPPSLSRREILKVGGLIVIFALPVRLTAAGNTRKAAAAAIPKVVGPGRVDGFPGVGRAGNLPLFPGKIGPGTGGRTAIPQNAAEELDVP